MSRDGSIDWLCFPRFDASACFAALVSAPENGHWKIVPDEPIGSSSRAYIDGTIDSLEDLLLRSTACAGAPLADESQ